MTADDRRVRAQTFVAVQRVQRPLAEVFEFFARAQNLEQITPPWLRFELTAPQGERIVEGSEISYRLRVHGVPVRWVSRIDLFWPQREFVDRQLSGPYRLWVHRHEFAADGPNATIVRDRVQYQLPFGIFGAIAHLAFVRGDLERIFAFRRQAIERLLG